MTLDLDLDSPADAAALYDALIARDPAYEGRAFVGVISTGVFCRLTCPARKPKRENAVFFSTAKACLEAGFRPCRRCRPLDALSADDPSTQALLKALDAEPDRRWSEQDVVRMGFDPSTVRRAFKRRFGMTFLEMARLRRVRAGSAALAGGSKVIDAQLDAGFESASGFRDAVARSLGRAPAQLVETSPLQADWIATPLGPMIAVSDDAGLRLLEFAARKALPRELALLEGAVGRPLSLGRSEPVEQLDEELAAFFAGRSARFATPLAPVGAPFAQAVWRALRDIPAGATRSFAAIARACGRPSAFRAVARANAANMLALVIPCHRVVGADGSLTGYGGGLWRKRWLIDHEARHFGGRADKGSVRDPNAER